MSPTAPTAPAPPAPAAGSVTCAVQEKSTSGGPPTSIGSSPSVNATNSADGSGTASIAPTSTLAGTTTNTEVLTYTVATGGIAANGAITLAVPSNWSAPQIADGTVAGYTQANIAGGGYATTGVSIATRTITVTTASALNAGDTVLIRYGDSTVNATGRATAPSAANAGSATWTVQEKSTSGGTLTSISSS